jgi:hypothetical protein
MNRMATESNITEFKGELKALIDEGELLRLSLALDLEMVDDDTEKQLHELKLPDFNEKYERWYSVSMQVVKQVLPDRLSDFVKQYKDESVSKRTF